MGPFKPNRTRRDTPTRVAVGGFSVVGPKKGAVVAGKYRLEQLIARGGMGAVWQALDCQLDRPVAIKFMDPKIAVNPLLRKRFNREAKAAARLRTPHVVQIYEHGVDGESPYIAMEYLEGEDLHKRLKRERRLGLHDMDEIVRQVARGLRAAHDAQIIHRDLKPQNIFLTREADELMVKILDFGVAKVLDPARAGEGTQAGIIVGSPHYMSPEQARGLSGFNHRSDLWSLGVIVFKCLTGHRPFKGEIAADVIVKICAEPIPSVHKVRPELPTLLDEFFAKALARDPDQRFQTSMEMARGFSETVAAIGTWVEAGPVGAIVGGAAASDSHPGTPSSGVLSRSGFTPSQPSTPGQSSSGESSSQSFSSATGRSLGGALLGRRRRARDTGAARSAAEGSAAESSAAERSAAERSAAESSAAESFAAESSAAERSAAAPSSAEGSAAEQERASRPGIRMAPTSSVPPPPQGLLAGRDGEMPASSDPDESIVDEHTVEMPNPEAVNVAAAPVSTDSNLHLEGAPPDSAASAPAGDAALLEGRPLELLNTPEALAGAEGVRNMSLVGAAVVIGLLLLVVVVVAVTSSPESTTAVTAAPSAPTTAPLPAPPPKASTAASASALGARSPHAESLRTVAPADTAAPIIELHPDEVTPDAGAPAASASASASAAPKRPPHHIRPGTDWGY